MENRCKKCGSVNLKEATQYMAVKKDKLSLKGSEVVLLFCEDCGEVQSLKLTNPKFK